MPTTIRIGRRTAHAKSDDLKQDQALYAEAQKLGAWLEDQDLAVVTAGQVLDHVQVSHPAATLARAAVWYEWVWDRVQQMWVLICHDNSSIAIPDTGANPVEIHVEISASY